MQLHLNFNPFPVLQTQRLTLRNLTLADAADFYTMRSDDEVLKYLDRPQPQSMDGVIDLIKLMLANTNNGEGIAWAITQTNMNRLIGTIGFWRLDKPNFRAEVGYMLMPAYHRQGIMHEALTAVLQYAFDTMNFHSIEANCNPANHASIQLRKKNGFVQEAYFKENYYHDGKFLDSLFLSLIAPKA